MLGGGVYRRLSSSCEFERWLEKSACIACRQTLQSFWQYRILLYLCINGREVRNFKWLFCDWEVYFAVAIGTRCACLMHDLIPQQDKDMLCSLLAIRVFQPSFWGSDYILWVLIVTNPAYRWLHFTPEKKGSAPSWLAEHFSWSVWLSISLHLHGTVRDTSQVHHPLGWYGSQVTSTCPPGLAPPFTPRPLASQ